MTAITNSGDCKTILVREKPNRIAVLTEKPLNDDQMRELHWIIVLMHETGLTIREILRKTENDILR